MQPLPPDAPIYQEVANAYRSRLQYQDAPHPRIFMTFSAIPGSGKTTLARRLAADLQAQYVSHDEMRDILRERDIDLGTIAIRFASKILIDEIMRQGPNRFIILDASLDRTWPIFFEHAAALKAKPFIIRLEVPQDVLRQRLVTRDGVRSELLQDIDRHTEQFNSCRRQVPADITLGEQYDYYDVLAEIRRLAGLVD